MKKVFIFDPNEGSGDFCKRLRKKIVNTYTCKVVTEVDRKTCFPLLVLVHNYSRIGTDIDTTLRDLPELDDEEKAKVVIVVYQIQQQHALPQLMPTSILTDDRYLKYGGLVDFFYTPEDKIYSCSLNETAKDNLRGYLKTILEQNTSIKKKKTHDSGESKACEQKKDKIRGKTEVPSQGKVRENTTAPIQGKAKELQMYDPNATAISVKFHQRLREKLYEYKIKEFKDADKVSPELPLIVIAQNYSRIGTDIDTALTSLPDIEGSNVALAVSHVQAEHALPIMSPTTTLTGDKYSRFGCMVDFFYTKENKIYSCSLNDVAEKKLKEFLKLRVEKKHNVAKTCTVQ